MQLEDVHSTKFKNNTRGIKFHGSFTLPFFSESLDSREDYFIKKTV